MTIFELGALGEFVGAIAVLFTLIYLAIQIRQNTISTRTASELQVTKMQQEWIAEWSRDSGLRRIWDDLIDGASVDDSDEARYLWRMSEYCIIAQGVLDQFESGMVSERCWMNIERSIVGTLQYDFARTWWDARAGNFSTALYERIDLVLSQNPAWVPSNPLKLPQVPPNI